MLDNNRREAKKIEVTQRTAAETQPLFSLQ
ncbi:MAG: hypothetical protein JWO92_241 [Chitinophagaceae bacterium]|nr:hypothetical protein [Chitinophagaceae bacterium]